MTTIFTRLTKISIALLACSGLTMPLAAAAEFPERPITLIVNSGPGGGVDIVARTYQPFLEQCLGASLVIVNTPGAGGAIAFAQLAESKPDGYTIGNINLPNTVTQPIERGGPPPWETFDYIANTTQSRVGLHVSKDSPYQTWQEFMDYAKANPKMLTVALGGLGNDDHITQLQAMQQAEIELTLVPIGDGASARTAALGEHVAAFSSA
ncbi:MAG TPA: tripartite tricarboxylate transporter substrate binding protein, partial [Devosia sp.]|nr:tripartite tricarboxylate transporter substrate binding protein [Devosia sp.]